MTNDDVARYDSESFSPALQGWLTFLRNQPRGNAQNEDLLSLIREEMPADLKAWLWTIGVHNPFFEFLIPFMPDVMRAEIALVDDDYYTGGEQTALEMLGAANAVQLTLDGGGHCALIATWKPGDESMTLHRLDNEEVSCTEIGTFQQLFDEAADALEQSDEDERSAYEDFARWAALVARAQASADEKIGASAPVITSSATTTRPTPKFEASFDAAEIAQIPEGGWKDGEIAWPAGLYPMTDVFALPVATVRLSAGYESCTIAWYFGRERHEHTFADRVSGFSPDSTATHALLTCEREGRLRVELLDLRTGEASAFYDPPDITIQAAALVDEARCVVVTTKHLMLLDRRQPRVTLSKVPIRYASNLHVVRQGQILVVSHFDGKDALTVWSTTGSRPRKLAGFPPPLSFISERDGVVYLDRNGELVELGGLA